MNNAKNFPTTAWIEFTKNIAVSVTTCHNWYLLEVDMHLGYTQTRLKNLLGVPFKISDGNLGSSLLQENPPMGV